MLQCFDRERKARGMTPRDLLLRAFPASDRESVRSGLDSAIAFGRDCAGIDAETEATMGAHDWMCRAGESLIDLALVAQIFKAQVRLNEEVLIDDFCHTATMLRDTAAASTRLVARALETHARDTGYAIDVWTSTAFDTANLFLQDSQDAGPTRVSTMPPLFSRIAARSLFDALAASNSDRMAVPGYLADSLGANLALFMHAQAVVSGAGEPQFS
jgi:hypothetical protein